MRVVHEGAAELVVVKPAGLPCEAPRDPAADTLLTRLAALGFRDLRLPHRLDAPACGLLLVARSAEAAAHYAREIEARRWLKIYVARVAAPPGSAAALVGPHRTFLKVQGRRAVVVRAGGKAAWLDVLAAAPAPDGRPECHVVVRLRTGRFHQIRAMLAHLGAPLTGDPRYGGPADRPFVLEHVLLGSALTDGGGWRTWHCPSHPDRDRWAPAIAARLSVLQAEADRGDAALLGEVGGPGGQGLPPH